MPQFDRDIVIAGGGPAGLSAALILGRARRSVLICDQGNQRNRASHAMHGFLTRDGISPADFLKLAHDDLKKYTSVELRQVRVLNAAPFDGGFSVTIEGGGEIICKKLLLATGVIDELPPIPGIDKYYGTSIFHCPYCDGFEHQNETWAAYGSGEKGRQLALELLGWTDHVILMTNGPSRLTEENFDQLKKLNITVIEDTIARLVGDEGALRSVRFTGGMEAACTAMFFQTHRFQKSALAEKLGCNLDERGLYRTNKFESTDIAGLYVAGDASTSLQLVVEAASSGAEAAFAINTALLREQIKEKLSR